MEQRNLSEVLQYLPPTIQEKLEGLLYCYAEEIEEIRLRSNAPLAIGMLGETCFITPLGGVTNHEEKAYRVSQREVQSAYLAVCEHSVYAHMEEICQGFLTLKGGHRVGICGKINTEDGCVRGFREVSSLNFRIAHQKIGVADGMMNRIIEGNKIKNTLLISPPQAGKTTMLRDIARQISNRGYKVGIADDRGEIAAMYHGQAQNDIGAQTDVIDSAPKALAIEMLLRTMAPRVIITDELASDKDVKAVCLAHGTGVSVIASAHGDSLQEVQERNVLKPLFEENVFERMILLKRDFSSMRSSSRFRMVLL